jgi:hypothetical protein
MGRGEGLLPGGAVSPAASPAEQAHEAAAEPEMPERSRRSHRHCVSLGGGCLTLPSKLTATELKSGFRFSEAMEEAETTESAESRPFLFERPGLSQGKTPLTGRRARGTALHLAMQYMDLRPACVSARGCWR